MSQIQYRSRTRATRAVEKNIPASPAGADMPVRASWEELVVVEDGSTEVTKVDDGG